MKSVVARNLAASLAITALTALAATACSGTSGGGDPTGTGSQAETTVTINAATIAALPAGQSYVVDVGRADTNYLFDYAAAPIDFSRVTIHFASDYEVPMTEWLAETATDGQDVVAQNPGHFELHPAQSDDPSVHIQSGGSCVTFCMWVCKAAMGPCVWTCITNCGVGTDPVIPVSK